MATANTPAAACSTTSTTFAQNGMRPPSDRLMCVFGGIGSAERNFSIERESDLIVTSFYEPPQAEQACTTLKGKVLDKKIVILANRERKTTRPPNTLYLTKNIVKTLNFEDIGCRLSSIEISQP
ncbi:hypothetical protein M422DRAFT_246902 [Sphaerobolus stellatus SS14]|nr:hypothetical protein M422DRAFT_246902 [Sphaerobolus stellatus SS14]